MLPIETTSFVYCIVLYTVLTYFFFFFFFFFSLDGYALLRLEESDFQRGGGDHSTLAFSSAHRLPHVASVGEFDAVADAEADENSNNNNNHPNNNNNNNNGTKKYGIHPQYSCGLQMSSIGDIKRFFRYS